MANSFKTKPSQRSEFINEFLMLMSYEFCRRVLYYLQQNDGTASVDGLIQYLSERSDNDPEVIAINLRSPILPRLDDIGTINYNPDSDRILYEGGSFTTEFINWLMDREEN